MSLRPQPPSEIPSDPPPHEGALIDIPMILEPPDVIVVEVLSALPGRPITGERLIRPDGKISLGFYGEIHVRGLTLEQAKVKVVLHLRQFLTDEVLALTHFEAEAIEDGPAEAMRGNVPPPPDAQPDVPKARDPQPPQPQRPDRAGPPQTGQSQRPRARMASARSGLVDPRSGFRFAQNPPDDDVAAAFQGRPHDPMRPGVIAVAPQDTNRVFIDIVSYNAKVYYVQGDIATPGRLPFTGKETVLDAVNFTGGLLTTAEPTDIHLYRPGVGGKPARDYQIDHAAILRGESRANLQIFPNDRLIVGRNAIVKKTIEIDRANSLTNSVFMNYISLNTALRSLNPNAVAESRLQLPEYFDMIWNRIAADPATLNDPARYRAFVAEWLQQTRRPR